MWHIGRQKIVAIVIAKDLTRQLKDNLTAWRALGGFNDLLHVAEHRAGKDRQLIPWLMWIIAGDVEAPRAGRFVVMHGALRLDEKPPFGKQWAPAGWRQTTASMVGWEWRRRRRIQLGSPGVVGVDIVQMSNPSSGASRQQHGGEQSCEKRSVNHNRCNHGGSSGSDDTRQRLIDRLER